MGSGARANRRGKKRQPNFWFSANNPGGPASERTKKRVGYPESKQTEPQFQGEEKTNRQEGSQPAKEPALASRKVRRRLEGRVLAIFYVPFFTHSPTYARISSSPGKPKA